MSSSPSGTIAITGATGFVGRAVSRQLIAQGFKLRSLVRQRRRRAPLGDQNADSSGSGGSIETVVGGLDDEAALEQLVAGARAVVHCAGMVRDGRGAFQATNVDGTRRLVRAAARQAVQPKILSISSLAAREPELSPYAASKHAGETAVREEANGAPWTILRPPAVYGPEDREVRPLFEWMMRGIAPILGPPSARFSLIFVDDLAQCIAHLIRDEHGSGGVYELHDGQQNGYGWGDVGQAISKLSGRSQRQLRVPATLIKLIAAANFTGQRALGRAPMLTLGKVRELRHADWTCDDSSLMGATSWRPRVRLDEGLRRTLFPPASDQTSEPIQSGS